MNALCRAVQSLRRHRLWDRAMLAERSGLSVAEIREIETGSRWCDPHRGDALIRAFAYGDDEATAFAILCAATFQAQWDAMELLADQPPQGSA
jgi:Helix-turn-helix domain